MAMMSKIFKKFENELKEYNAKYENINLNNFIKGCLRYRTIFYHKVALDM